MRERERKREREREKEGRERARVVRERRKEGQKKKWGIRSENMHTFTLYSQNYTHYHFPTIFFTFPARPQPKRRIIMNND